MPVTRLTCPECDERFRLQRDYDPDERVRCPACDWSFGAADGVPGYPVTVRLAAILWLALGTVLLLVAGGSLLVGSIETLIGGVLVGVIFLVAGCFVLSGNAQDVLSSAVGSCVVGFLTLAGGCMLTLGTRVDRVAMLALSGTAALCGVGLLVTGVVALVGRSDYLAWHAAQEDEEEAEARPRRKKRPRTKAE